MARLAITIIVTAIFAAIFKHTNFDVWLQGCLSGIFGYGAGDLYEIFTKND